MSFGEELAKQLDLASGVRRPAPYKTPLGTARGFSLRLGYVLGPKTGVSLDRAAELIGVSKRTIRAWQRGRKPSRASRDKLDRVYTGFLETKYKARVSKQAGKLASHMAPNTLKVTNDSLDDRFYKPRSWWLPIVDAWSNNDLDGLDDIWEQIIEDWPYKDAWMPPRIIGVQIV